MKNRLFCGKAYGSLVRTLFYQTLATIVASALITIGLRFVFRGKIANILVDLICLLNGVDWDTGVNMYRVFYRNNIGSIMVIIVLIIFVVLFRVYLSWFTKYFDQIVTGIDQLAKESDNPIVMSPKLKFIETTLNESNQKLKSREKEAREAEQRKNELVVYLAHDIKTPLTSVIGYLSLLDGAQDMTEQQKMKYTHTALEKAYRLEMLINEFFEITRYNVKDVPLNKSPIDLRFMLVQITDELYPQFTSHGNEIQLNMQDEITLFCDPDKMARALNNILKNAVAYSFPNTPITITCEKYNDSVEITIMNHGQTISSDNLASIFEKFYRLDDARNSGTGGAGLGLSIAKEIITRHEGTISAKSVDEMITFIVTLPMAN